MENKTVNFGLIAGGSVVVILFIMDLINNRMMVSIGMNYFPTLILLIAMILSVREAKKDYEVLEFSEAFKHAFLPFVIGNGIYLIFNHLMYNYIDPELPALAREKALEIFDKGLFNNIISDEDREVMMDMTREQSFQPTIGQTFTGYMFSLVFPGGAVGLILAAIFRTRTKQ